MTPNGIRAAVDIGSRLEGDYDMFVSVGGAALYPGARLHPGRAWTPFRPLVEEEARRFGGGLRWILDWLPESGRALIVGHSPMHEVAIYGLTGKIVRPIAKGAGVLVVAAEEGFSVELLSS